MRNGAVDDAIESFQRSVDSDPDHKNGHAILERLREKSESMR